MIIRRTGLPDDHPVVAAMHARLDRVLAHVDARCAEAPCLAGAAFSAADVMSVFSLTTMRSFCPADLGPHARIRDYPQQRIGTRQAYRRAMDKGDPGMEPMLG